MAEFTIVTAIKPSRLGKKYELVNGQLIKSPGGQLVQGTLERVEVQDLSDLATRFSTLSPNQAVTYGTPRDHDARTVASRATRRGKGTITRTEADFEFSNGPGIMMLDYDPDDGAKALSRDDLLERIYSAVPALKGAQIMWVPFKAGTAE